MFAPAYVPMCVARFITGPLPMASPYMQCPNMESKTVAPYFNHFQLSKLTRIVSMSRRLSG